MGIIKRVWRITQCTRSHISDSNRNQSCVWGFSRNLFYILWNIPTMVLVLCNFCSQQSHCFRGGVTTKLSAKMDFQKKITGFGLHICVWLWICILDGCCIAIQCYLKKIDPVNWGTPCFIFCFTRKGVWLHAQLYVRYFFLVHCA